MGSVHVDVAVRHAVHDGVNGMKCCQRPDVQRCAVSLQGSRRDFGHVTPEYFDLRLELVHIWRSRAVFDLVLTEDSTHLVGGELVCVVRSENDVLRVVTVGMNVVKYVLKVKVLSTFRR